MCFLDNSEDNSIVLRFSEFIAFIEEKSWLLVPIGIPEAFGLSENFYFPLPVNQFVNYNSPHGRIIVKRCTHKV